MIIKNLCFISKNLSQVYSRKNSSKLRREFQSSRQLTMSLIRLSIDNFNENNNQNIDDNMSIEKISGRRKRRRMLLHMRKNVLSSTTINHFKFVQKLELKINSIKKDCFVKTSQIRYSIRKKMKRFLRASCFSHVDKFVHYSTIHNTEDHQLTNNETHQRIETTRHISWCHLRHFRFIVDHIKHEFFFSSNLYSFIWKASVSTLFTHFVRKKQSRI